MLDEKSVVYTWQNSTGLGEKIRLKDHWMNTKRLVYFNVAIKLRVQVKRLDIKITKSTQKD